MSPCRVNRLYISQLSRLNGVFFLLLCLCASSSWAQKLAPAAESVGSGVPSHSSYLIQVLLGLFFVLALVFAIAWLIKRVGHGTLVGGQQMQVLASLPLGTRERVLLVDVAGQQLVLGVAPGRISTLHTFSEPVVNVRTRGDSSDFGAKLRELMGAGVIETQQDKTRSGVVGQ